MAAATFAQDAQQMPFIKNLASSDRKLRTSSLSSLQAFLSSRRDLTPLDARKLWTGLYYALWMTDRPRPQQNLASDLANLVFDLPQSLAPVWFAAFWAVLGAQWPHIEALRMDKFLLLVRRVFAAHVRFARGSSSSSASSSGGGDDDDGGARDAAQQVLLVFKTWCFDAQDDQRKIGLGLRLHVLDIWVDELERQGALPPTSEQEDEEDANPAAARDFVKAVGELVEELKRSSSVKSIRQRAMQSLEDERLPWVAAAAAKEGGEQGDAASADDEEDDEWGGIDD